MKYSDLIKFEPIETVIQLREANSHDKARNLVETFVISDQMAEKLAELVFPNLQFAKPADSKGLFIVGNYGTGKSHLMSFISALAEHADLAESARNKNVVKAAKSTTGKFKVIRSEIGATTMSLRDIICGELEDHLSKMGVVVSFPPANKVRNNKDALIEMMGKFTDKYPNHGLVMLVDELLDYLRTRNNQEVILDLNFLREVGEVCSLVRFRFLAGIQEALFDNPRFQFVADSVRRVRDRFVQVPIVRKDVAHVVSERLLTKTDEQKAWIREHLHTFTPLYDSMAERLEEFVRMFPVHPAYLDRFELISIAEKREVLKTLSAEMRRLLDKEVPSDETGLVSYDSYWTHLKDNPAIRALPEVREVIDKSTVLENRIKQAFTRKAYTPMALRVSHALSVHRLTTDDIYAKIGPTAAELRDDLCLFHAGLPEKTSDFLRTTVESCMKEIVRTMSGQFITHNKENDQYYLDLHKFVDYDAEIEKRAAVLSDSELDDYYFDALKRLMDCEDQTYVTGYRIWEHEVEWREHKVTRRGYLFFGAPNERSTAQPPRDFYVYFIQPFHPPKYKDDKLADEVFFALKHPDESFLQTLKLYAGARAWASQATSTTRKEYENKADDHLKSLTGWLRDHMLTAFDVTHQGVPKKMVEFLKGHRTGSATVSDLVNLAGSIALGPCFSERYPEYPSFSVMLTASNLGDAASDCIRFLTGGLRTQIATAVLDGLEVLDAEKVRPSESRYAKSVLKKLQAKGNKEVLNRSELITTKQGVEVETDFKLEPELLILVLLALVHSGDITISLVGKTKIDASMLPEVGKTAVDDFCKFRHVERPKDIPLSALVALFELVGLSEGLIRDPNLREEAIKQLREKSDGIVKRLVVAKQDAQSGLPCWGHELIPVEERKQQQERLDGLQQFLERLQAFNTPGKLKNFPHTVEEVQAQRASLELLDELDDTKKLVTDLRPMTDYLTTAKAVLPQTDKWSEGVDKARTEWQSQLLDPTKRKSPEFRQKLLQAIEKLKKAYQDHYFDMHKKSRLGVNEDKKKTELTKDARLKRLQQLLGIALLPHGNLTELQSKLANLKPCYALVKDDLSTNPICPHCGFRPTEESSGPSATVVLGHIDEEIDKLLANWTKTLLDNLADPTAKQSIDLLESDQKKAVNSLLKAKELPEKVSNALVQGIQNALSGLTPISVTASALLAALSDGGAPCTVEQLNERFEKFVQELIHGSDISKVRIIIQKDTPAIP